MGLKFIDLYAGLGGFHQGLTRLGHKAVWACEQNENLRKLYQINYDNTPIEGDIFKVDLNLIPDHDVICGGFPCQPFSRAGYMKGFEDENKGNHFFKILEIIDAKKKKSPQYIFLENVETLLRHDNNNTFKIIKTQLEKRGYEIDYKVLSPHEFNIPHHRRRLFIVGSKKKNGGLSHFSFPEKLDISKTTIKSVLDKKLYQYPGEKLKLSYEENTVVNTWEKFISNFPDDSNLPSFPVWSHEWGATYPFEKCSVRTLSINEILEYKGSYGKEIKGNNLDEAILNYIPRYSQNDLEYYPAWKVTYIKKNRDFYQSNKDYIDRFMIENPQLFDFEFSYQKLEWSCQRADRTFKDKILQFRPSGLRVKLNNWIPALTTVRTQNVYVPEIKRKISLTELCEFQSLILKKLPDTDNINKFHQNGGYRAFGNAVNAEVVKLIAEKLLK